MISWVCCVTQVAWISPLWGCTKLLFISKHLSHWSHLNILSHNVFSGDLQNTFMGKTFMTLFICKQFPRYVFYYDMQFFSCKYFITLMAFKWLFPCVCSLMTYKNYFWAKPKSHRLHLNGFSLLCVFWWHTRIILWGKLFIYFVHI